MKILRSSIRICIVFSCYTLASNCLAQTGQVNLNEDDNIKKLLNIHTDLKANEDYDSYRIQVYYGHSREKAESVLAQYKKEIGEWPAELLHDYSYKIWIGTFNKRIEADRALLKIKKVCTGAFVTKPKKED